MNRVEEFVRYVGIVILVSTSVLLAPRATVLLWSTFTGWLRSCRAAMTRGNRVEEEPRVDVVVRVGKGVPVGTGRRHYSVEVLDVSGAATPSLPELGRVRDLVAEIVEPQAVLLALCAIGLRQLSDLLVLLPDAFVMTGALTLVLGTFLVMRRVIRFFPAEHLPGRREPLKRRRPEPLRPRLARVPRSDPQAADAGTLPDGVRLIVLAVAVFLLLTWPSRLGSWLATVSFTHRSNVGPAVSWACELPWLLVLSLLLAREQRRPVSRRR